jgi:glycosyltransferase involved in cell wall biosynthesis
MRKIILNARCLLSPMTGVQRYTSCILNNLAAANLVDIRTPCKKFSNGYLGHFWEQCILPAKCNKELLFSPANTGPIFYKNQVITIHDITPLEHPEWYSKNFAKAYSFLIPKIAKTVKHIITVSEYSARRIANIIGIDEKKISAIPLGVDSSFFNSTGDTENNNLLAKFKLTGKKYILSLSSISPRKNIKRLLEAWSQALLFLPEDINLVLVGDELSVSSSYDFGKIPDRVYFLGRIEDCHLPTLYANSLMFIFVSLCEGFGLPILEAMACKTPVITSNITSMIEVGGDAALLVDPYDVKNIAAGITKVATDENLRQKLIADGLARASNFTWEKTATMTIKVLEDNL